MNFYQRANLALGINVILGLQLAIAGRIGNLTSITPDQIIAKSDILIWIAFQFLFRVKVTLDDHEHFSVPRNADRNDVRKLIDLLFFISSTFAFIMAAGLSFNFAASGFLFICGLAIATAWAAFNWRNAGQVKQWVALNILYIAVIGTIACVSLDKNLSTVMHLALLMLLVVDYKISETHKHMPEY